MKKYLSLILFIALSINANAQLLWKISGNDLEKPSYILGTHHLAPLSVTDSIAGLSKVMDETLQVYGEVIMEEMNAPATLQMMQKHMMMPADTTMKSLFTTEEYEAVNKIVKEVFQAELSMIAQLKPAAINQQLSVMLYLKEIPGYNPQEQLDTYFQQQAVANGKKVGGLESVQSQIDILFNQQPLKRQATLLHCAAINIEKDMLAVKELTNAYMAQDLEKVHSIIQQRNNDSCDPTLGELEALIDNRNRNWVEKMPAIMLENPTLFVVGAGHLLGGYGVLTLLKQKGYNVEPMN